MFFIGQNYVQHRVKTFLRLIFELLLKFIQILNILVNFGSLFSTFVRRLVEFKENLQPTFLIQVMLHLQLWWNFLRLILSPDFIDGLSDTAIDFKFVTKLQPQKSF